MKTLTILGVWFPLALIACNAIFLMLIVYSVSCVVATGWLSEGLQQFFRWSCS